MSRPASGFCCPPILVFCSHFVRFGRGLGKLRSSLCFALTAQLRGAKRVLAKSLKPVFAGNFLKNLVPPHSNSANSEKISTSMISRKIFLPEPWRNCCQFLGSKILMSVDDFSLSTHKKKNREMTDQK